MGGPEEKIDLGGGSKNVACAGSGLGRAGTWAGTWAATGVAETLLCCMVGRCIELVLGAGDGGPLGLLAEVGKRGVYGGKIHVESDAEATFGVCCSC